MYVHMYNSAEFHLLSINSYAMPLYKFGCFKSLSIDWLLAAPNDRLYLNPDRRLWNSFDVLYPPDHQHKAYRAVKSHDHKSWKFEIAFRNLNTSTATIVTSLLVYHWSPVW